MKKKTSAHDAIAAQAAARNTDSGPGQPARVEVDDPAATKM